jgi:hypothetical protein
VPFSTGFVKVTRFEKDLYFVTLLLAAVATGLLIAPSMHHRILFRQDDKAHLVKVANTLMIAGLTTLACSITCAVVLVAHFLFGERSAWIAGGVSVATFGTVWYVMPLQRRLRNRRSNLRRGRGIV